MLSIDTYSKARRDVYEAYNDEVSQVLEDYEDGIITADQRRTYLTNLANNLDSDLGDLVSK